MTIPLPTRRSSERVGRRTAGGDEWNQTGAPGSFQRGEAAVDAAHTSTPSRAAIVCTSLSPRPERLHNTMPSFGYSRASLIACATAWLDSSAARMQIGRAHVCTPVTNAHLVCRLLLEKKKQK